MYKSKEVNKEKCKEYYQKHKGRINEGRRIKVFQEKNCSICKSIFNSNNQRHLTCSKECQKERSKINNKIYYNKNKEKILSQVKKYRIENRELISERGKIYRKNNIKTEEQRIKERKNYLKWEKNNIHKKYAEIRARTKAKEMNLKKDKCEKCESKENLQMHHKDYTKYFDVVTLCAMCHSRLHAGWWSL